MYYLLAMSFFLLFYYISQTYKKSTYLLLSFGMLPLSFLAIFRGNVGPDTTTYFAILEELRVTGVTKANHELFFAMLSEFLLDVFDNSYIVIGLFSLIFTMLILFAAKRIDKYAVVFATIIVPILYIDMTMNAIRIGLSFSIIFFSILYLARGEIKKYFILGIVSGLFHISGLLITILIYSLFTKKWKVIFISIIFSFAILYFLNDYILMKLISYEVMSSPSIFSGISTLMISLLFIFVWATDTSLKQNSNSILFFSFLYVISSYLLIFISYAGLRIQNLVFISIILAFLIHIYKNNIYINNKTKIKFLAIGIIGFMFKFKNFYDGYGIGAAPFLPYHFIWN